MPIGARRCQEETSTLRAGYEPAIRFAIVGEQPAASDLYSLTYVKPRRWRFWLAALTNLISQSMITDGSGHAVFRRRDTDELVGEFKEPFVAGAVSEYTAVVTDYWTMTAEEFEQAWLTG